MAGNPADPDDHAAMLERAVWIPEPSPDGTHIGLDRKRDEFLEPLCREDLDVVVEQADEFAPRSGDGGVVEPREVEGGIVAKHRHPGQCRDLGQTGQRAGIDAAIVADHDLVVAVGGP